MKCPSCKTVLCRIDYEGMPICTCPGCHGEFLDGTRLKQIERKNAIRFDRAEQNVLKHMRTGPEKERQLICPRCGNLMSKGRYRITDVVIDHCNSCKGVWLDDRELEKIQVFGEAGKTERAARPDNRPGLTEAVIGTRAAARSGVGKSTDGQGFAAGASTSDESMNTPRLWLRAALASLLLIFLGAWISGLIHSLLPIERILGRGVLREVDMYLPAILATLAAIIAFTFKKVTIRPGHSLEVRQYILGIPWKREYARGDIKCIGTDYQEILPDDGRVSGIIFELLFYPRYWSYLRLSRARIGVSCLYIVLKSGKRIPIYKGTDDSRVGELSDFLQEGLKLEVRRL
jgi:Zn-finger nucleic acid-binding protein